MLVLTRKVGESIVIDGDITITVVGVQENKIRLGVEAPEWIKVWRSELLTAQDAPSPGQEEIS
jgi:carbon storage regulator